MAVNNAIHMSVSDWNIGTKVVFVKENPIWIYSFSPRFLCISRPLTSEEGAEYRMNNKSFKQPVMEVDIAELFWELLEQWKAILLLAIIMACVVCGTKYVNDMKSYNAEVAAKTEAEAQANIPADERIADLLNSLPSSEVADAKLVIMEKEWLFKQKEYLNNSLFMDTDPSNQIVLTLVCDIKADDVDTVPALVNSFDMYVESDDFAEIIKPTIDQTAETNYIGELINSGRNTRERVTVDDSNGSFKISIILIDESKAEETASAAINALKEYSAQLSSSHLHTLSIADQDISVIYNYADIERQRHILDKIDEMETTSNTAESELTAPQKQVVSEALNIFITSETAKSIGTADFGDETEPVVTGWSRKHALLGFILGVVLYAGIFTMVLILRGCVTSARAAERYSGVRLLGEVYQKESTSTGIEIILRSKAIESLRYRDKGDSIAQIKKIAESITAVCKHKGTNECSLINITHCDEGCNEIMSLIAAETAKMGVKTDIISLDDDFDEKQLLSVENAVLVTSHRTKVPMLGKINALCNAFTINILGCVYATAK